MAKQRNHSLSLPGERRTTGRRGPLSWRPTTVLVALAGAFLLASAVRYANHQTRVRRTQVAIVQLKDAIERFRADVQRCPQTTREILHPPAPTRRYLHHIPTDGWGRPLHVRCPSQIDETTVDVISAGPSGSLFQDDNIQ